MKKLVLLPIITLITVLCFGQETMPDNSVKHSKSSSQVKFGLKAGINVANIEDGYNPNYTSNRIAYHFGGIVHIPLMPHLAIQPEVVYSSQGAKYSAPAYKGKEKINFVNVPVLMQYLFENNIRLEAGPQLGILTNAKHEATNGAETDITYYKGIDFSVAFGAGFLTSKGIGLDIRYNLGLSDFYKTGPQTVKNRVWQFGLFYQFNNL